MSDWSLVGGDPAPGDPGQLRFRLNQVDRVAGDIRELSAELSRIDRGATEADWRGQAAGAMKEVLDSFRHDLAPISRSFENLSKHLSRYADELEALQRLAKQALQRAHIAELNRKADENAKSVAAATLGAQRRALLTNQGLELSHRATTAFTLDPVGKQVDADIERHLAQETQRAQQAVTSAEAEVTRIQVRIDQAVSDLDDARSKIKDYASQWETVSKAAAGRVEDSLASELANLSNLQKALNQVGEVIYNLGNFMENPIEALYQLRDIIGWIGDLAGMVALGLTLLAPIVGVIFAPAGAALLGFAATAATIAAACAVTKLVLTLFLTTQRDPDGRPRVGGGDIGSDGVNAILSVIGAKKAMEAAVKSKEAAKLLVPKSPGGVQDLKEAWSRFRIDQRDGYKYTKLALELPFGKVGSPITGGYLPGEIIKEGGNSILTYGGGVAGAEYERMWSRPPGWSTCRVPVSQPVPVGR